MTESDAPRICPHCGRTERFSNHGDCLVCRNHGHFYPMMTAEQLEESAKHWEANGYIETAAKRRAAAKALRAGFRSDDFVDFWPKKKDKALQ